MADLTQHLSGSARNIHILVIGDKSIERNTGVGLVGLLFDYGYGCYEADDGEQAVTFIQQQKIDLIAIGCLPNGRGTAATIEQIKQHVSSAYIPILCIEERVEAFVLEQCIAAGADDFLIAPLQPTVLIAKIRLLLRNRAVFQEEIDHRRQLLEYQRLITQEQEVAANLAANILQAHYLQTEAVIVSMSPMALFNGDILLVARTPDDHLHLLLGDFTGHGLSASIGALPTAEIFYGMTGKGFGMEEIAVEINRKLHKLLPRNMFLAATLLAVYPDSKTLNVMACGLPEHFLVNRRTNTLQIVTSVNIPLGILDDQVFKTQQFSVNRDCYLYLMTDGIFEAQNSLGEPFGLDRILECVNLDSYDDIDVLRSRLDDHCWGEEQEDDITLVKLICDVDRIPWKSSDQHQEHRAVDAFSWKNIMEFDVLALRKLNPVPVMVNALMEIQGLQEYRQVIFLIVTELFANALDHGILQLDSTIKQSPDGFLRFYEMKEQRLQSQQTGFIRFSFIHQPTNAGGRLTIKVRDSGQGFDWRKRSVELHDNDGLSGRGIRLMETLCKSVVYQGNGNRVTAVFEWTQ